MKNAVPTQSCLSCGAEVIWAVNDSTGVNMPVNPEPVENGNVLLSIVSSGERRFVGGKARVRVLQGAIVAHVLTKDEEVAPGRVRRVAHFATCPRQLEWRGRKRKARQDKWV